MELALFRAIFKFDAPTLFTIPFVIPAPSRVHTTVFGLGTPLYSHSRTEASPTGMDCEVPLVFVPFHMVEKLSTTAEAAKEREGGRERGRARERGWEGGEREKERERKREREKERERGGGGRASHVNQKI